LNEEKKQQVIALGRLGWSLRRIQRNTGVRRETAAAYLKGAGIAFRPPGGWGRQPPAKPANEVITDSAAAKPANEATSDPAPAKPANEAITDFGAELIVSATAVLEPQPGRSPSASACAPYREATGQLLREHLRQARGGHRIQDQDRPKNAAGDAGPVVPRRQGRISDRSALPGNARRARRNHGAPDSRRAVAGKKYGAPSVEEACAAALEMGVCDYRFVRRYLERLPGQILVVQPAELEGVRAYDLQV
jgi:hypothetical protein